MLTSCTVCLCCVCSDPLCLSLSARQGLMFGYATDETEECMPLTIVLAHKLNSKMAELRRNGVISWLRPDSKTQVTLRVLLQHKTEVSVWRSVLLLLWASSKRFILVPADTSGSTVATVTISDKALCVEIIDFWLIWRQLAADCKSET